MTERDSREESVKIARLPPLFSFLNFLTPHPIQQTTNPLRQERSSSCFITPVSKVTSHPTLLNIYYYYYDYTASAQNDINLENWIYVSSNALAQSGDRRERVSPNKTRVRTRTGDEKFLGAVCMCVCSNDIQSYGIIQKIMTKILQDHICPNPLLLKALRY